MDCRLSKCAVRVRVFLGQNRWLLGALVVWFAAGFAAFHWHYQLEADEALRSALYLRAHATDASADFSFGYTTWGQALVLGVVLGLVVQNLLDHQNPERWCRSMAQLLRDHVVVIGYSHLGQRLIKHFRERAVPYVLIEREAAAVDELLRAHEPVVVDDAREADALSDAGVASAKAVIVASNNEETALLVTKRVRDLNRRCPVIVRYFHDDVAEVLESLGASRVISSSKAAFEEVQRDLEHAAPPAASESR